MDFHGEWQLRKQISGAKNGNVFFLEKVEEEKQEKAELFRRPVVAVNERKRMNFQLEFFFAPRSRHY